MRVMAPPLPNPSAVTFNSWPRLLEGGLPVVPRTLIGQRGSEKWPPLCCLGTSALGDEGPRGRLDQKELLGAWGC